MHEFVSAIYTYTIYFDIFRFLFAAGVFRDTFSSLRHINPQVVYPIPNFEALQQPPGELTEAWEVPRAKIIFLSINRYERKKNLELAIKALGKGTFELHCRLLLIPNVTSLV